MRKYTSSDIKDYYDQTASHFRRFWKMDKVMGLHYGIWSPSIQKISDAILHTNQLMMEWGKISPNDKVLDAGCGVGGSSIFLSKTLGCYTHGITLSHKQVERAHHYAKLHQVDDLCTFSVNNYLDTGYPDATFDVVWALESFSSCTDNPAFFTEMSRILKSQGRLLILDFFKPYTFDIDHDKDLQTMMNGWAISDIMTIDEIKSLPLQHHFSEIKIIDYTKEISRSVQYMYRAGWLGMIGTKVYNLFKKATPFSRIHYKTGIAQKRAYDKGSWGYYMIRMVKTSK